MSDHSPAVHEHHDPQANRIGMWLFLTTEVILFSGVFLAYAVYYHQYSHPFKVAAANLDKILGAVNTVVLLTSSLTVALAIGALQRGRKGLALACIMSTVGFALTFLVVKAFEWSHKFHEGLYPASAVMADRPPGERIYFGVYYLATGLHAVHVLVGMVLLTWVGLAVHRGRVSRERSCLMVNAGLYWHLVDLIWIYLFPLFYLIG